MIATPKSAKRDTGTYARYVTSGGNAWGMTGLRRALRATVCASVIALLTSCAGGDKPGTTEPPPPQGGPAALSLSAPDSIIAGQAFALRVDARMSSGQPDLTWQGTVSLSASVGQITPNSVQLVNGAVTVQAAVANAAGTITLTAAVGAVRGVRPTFALSGEPAVRLEIAPGALLLAGAGQTLRLTARAFDADGRATTAPVTWESSRPATVSVSAAGVATAVVNGGSAQIIARAGTVASAPVLALVAVPPSGAVLVADAQIVGDIVPLDPGAPYGPGYQYRARLRGVVPVVGQLLLGSGERPFGGRVVGLSTIGGDIDVTLELLSVAEMLPGLTIDEVIPLGATPSSFAPRAPWEAAASTGLGFTCEAKAGLAPIDATAILPQALSASMAPLFSLHVVWVSPTSWKFVVGGGLEASLAVTVKTSAAVQGSAECEKKLGQFILPVGGFLALFLGGQVDYGVGFGIEGKASAGDVGNELTIAANALVFAGIDCLAACTPVISTTGNATGEFKPLVPLVTSGLQFELTASGYAWAKLVLGQPFIQTLRFKTFEAKAGLKQEFKLAGSAEQARDPAYASAFQLAAFFEGGTTSKLDSLAQMLSITMAQLKVAPEWPLAQSPRGTITIAPATVRATTGSAAGDSATMIVNLDPVTYLTSYAVDSVEIFRKVSGLLGSVTLQPARGACAQIAPTTPNQEIFTCRTDFTSTEIGSQEYYAFVKPKVRGVPLPLLLEVATDGKAGVQVDSAAATVTLNPSLAQLVPGESRQFTATVTGVTDTTVTWTATGGTISSTGLYTAGQSFGTFEVKATSVADPAKSATAAITVSEGPIRSLRIIQMRRQVFIRQPFPEPDCIQDLSLRFDTAVPPAQTLPSATCTFMSQPFNTGTASTTAGENYSLQTQSGQTTLTVTGTTSAQYAPNGADGFGSANAMGFADFVVEFDVVGASVSFTLSGTLSSAISNSLPASEAGSYINFNGPQGFEIEEYAGRLGFPCTDRPICNSSNPAVVPLNRSAVLAPGSYTLALFARSAAYEQTPGGGSVTGSAGFTMTLTLRP